MGRRVADPGKRRQEPPPADGVHFIVCSAATFPIAYITQWMAHSLWGVLSYFAVFAGIYIVIWLTQYAAVRRRLKKMNMRMKEHPFEP